MCSSSSRHKVCALLTRSFSSQALHSSRASRSASQRDSCRDLADIYVRATTKSSGQHQRREILRLKLLLITEEHRTGSGVVYRRTRSDTPPRCELGPHAGNGVETLLLPVGGNPPRSPRDAKALARTTSRILQKQNPIEVT